MLHWFLWFISFLFFFFFFFLFFFFMNGATHQKKITVSNIIHLLISVAYNAHKEGRRRWEKRNFTINLFHFPLFIIIIITKINPKQQSSALLSTYLVPLYKPSALNSGLWIGFSGHMRSNTLMCGCGRSSPNTYSPCYIYPHIASPSWVHLHHCTCPWNDRPLQVCSSENHSPHSQITSMVHSPFSTPSGPLVMDKQHTGCPHRGQTSHIALAIGTQSHHLNLYQKECRSLANPDNPPCQNTYTIWCSHPYQDEEMLMYYCTWV